MTITILIPPEEHRIRQRLRKLETLRSKVDLEIEAARTDLRALRQNRSKNDPRPACATEAGYQWHRYHERDNWPLPKDDPCGCRAAHRAHFRRNYVPLGARNRPAEEAS